MKELKNTVESIVKDIVKIASLECTVKSVDADKGICTCTTVRSGLDIENVRLRAVQGEDGLKLIPKEGSKVIIARIENMAGLFTVIQYSELKEVRLKTERVVINDGSNGGLTIIGELVKKLNQLESKHNALCSQLEALPVPVNGSVSGPPVPGSYSAVKIPNQTQVSELENKKVTH